MKRFLLIIFTCTMFLSAMAQNKTKITGVVQDSETNETLVGANVLVKEGVGTITDIDGKYTIEVENGNYNIQFSFVGYTSISKKVKAEGTPIKLDADMENNTLDEVKIVSDIARERVTPVAFTNVTPIKLVEQLGGQDLPMILNTTPGVHATQTGGGDGDARITIRGFSQRNVAVMIDGIPVNDMENGWVYWSNWFGLDAVTRSIQVQRGLGASKLALPSVGGTMNIITKGIENKREILIKQDIDGEGKSTTQFGYTSGTLKNGWGFTVAGAYKKGDGWVEQTSSEGWFGYFKVDKRFDNHIVSLSAMGAPQQHEQRSYKRAIAAYDTAYARELGVKNFPQYVNKGLKYNQHWGNLKRDRYNSLAKSEAFTEALNIYSKPQFSLRDYWKVSDNLNITNILYLSIGKGGGTRPNYSLTDADLDSTGHVNWQKFYDKNTKLQQNSPFEQPHYPIDPKYSATEYKGEQYMQLQKNEHFWYGLLTSATYKLNGNTTLSGGVDLRSYTGSHYGTVYDLLGSDYIIDIDNKTINYVTNPMAAVKHKGDTVYYNYNGYVRRGGFYTQIEYQTGLISTYMNVSGAMTGYKKEDFFTSTESVWKVRPSFTIKGGLNFNINESSNVFLNLGYLTKSKDFKYFYKGYTANFVDKITNEEVQALEAGYNFHSNKFTTNVNAYLTQWINKPTSQVTSKYDGENVYADIDGMDAQHMGVEVDFVYKVLHNLDLQGSVSLGNWVWNKKVDNLIYYFSNNNEPADTISFDATGIHVGDAAQTQFAVSFRYEPIKGLYFNGKYTFYDRYYSDFNPEQCTDANGNPIDSWQIPSYSLVDMSVGYNFKVPQIKKIKFSIRLNVFNIFDKMYISDATNNDTYITPNAYQADAASASVFFGMGRRFMTSFSLTF